jgi:transposase
MPRTSPYRIELTDDERARLEVLARSYSSPHRDVVRAKVVLLAAGGLSNEGIAVRLDIPRQIVSKWRKRFYKQRLAGLRDRPRTGRPPAFSPEVVVAIKALACELPDTCGVPLSRWHAPDLARAAVEQGIVASISGTTVWRWLSADAIRPWQHRSWVFPRDPDFAEKAGQVLDLYQRRFAGETLGEKDFVICADEKTSIQARARKHPTTPPAPGQPMRVEHEYERGGALAYLAAWDVHRAKLFGRCEPSTGIEPFRRLVEQVMGAEPYASADRVFWIVDNGSSHHGRASIERLQGAFSNLVLIHLPVHASWLNQIEIYFSIIQRELLAPNDFADLKGLEARLLAFQSHYEQIAEPFEWRFTRADLDALLARLHRRTSFAIEAA